MNDEEKVAQGLVDEAHTLGIGRFLGRVSEEDYIRGQALLEQRAAEHDAAMGRAPESLLNFEIALLLGATCEQLYELKNNMHAKDEDKRKAHDLLREIGCHSTWSTRTDIPE